MAAVGYAGNEGFLLDSEDRLAALVLPLYLQVKVRPRSSSHSSPVKSHTHLIRESHNTDKPQVHKCPCKPLIFVLLIFIVIYLFIWYLVVHFKLLCLIIPDLKTASMSFIHGRRVDLFERNILFLFYFLCTAVIDQFGSREWPDK